MRVDHFDFELPPELIALRPADPRDAAKLLVVEENGALRHARLHDLAQFLRPGDVLVVNNSKVLPARLVGMRAPRQESQSQSAPSQSAPSQGAAVEVTLHKRLGPQRFLAFAKPAKRLRAGDHLRFAATLQASVLARDGGEVELAFDCSGHCDDECTGDGDGDALDAALEEFGEMPLPPYIASKRKPDARDRRDYQTIFAAHPGSVAAPTAGLHFTPALLERLASAHIARESVTLHVGPGTFLPVTAADTNDHRMQEEWAVLTDETATRLNAIRAQGGRIVAVGSTALRTLESAADDSGCFHAFCGATDIFLTPGDRFKAVDVLLTNFHLPRSTLFMLVAAFSGLEVMKAAYRQAIDARYRFYSYGDACLLFRANA